MVLAAVISAELVVVLRLNADSVTPTATPISTATPTPTPSGSPGAEPSTAKVRCWDGTGAQQVSECPPPTGRAGLEWVFPLLAEQKCGAPSTTGPEVELRILCADRLQDGSRVVLGYVQWRSVDDAYAFFEGQELDRSDVPDAGGNIVVHQWTGTSGDTQKVVGLYAEEPFSISVRLPESADFVQDALGQVAVARPADQVRGEPVG